MVHIPSKQLNIGSYQNSKNRPIDQASMVLLTGAMASVIFKLGKLLNEEYKLQTGVRRKIQTLMRDLESMHAVLTKVGAVPHNQLDSEVKLWARDVRELSYNVDDILDTFLVRVDSCDEDPAPNKLFRKIGKMFRKIKDHHQISGMIKTIDEQAEEVAERHRRYRADDIVAKPATTSTVDPRLAAMFRNVSQLIGIDKSRGELMYMLSLSEEGDDSSSNEKMKIVSVVGAGGLGKTTLVKAVYDSLKPKFYCGAFVPVGQNPDLKKVLRDILIDLDKNVYMNFNLEKLDERQLLNELQGFLRKKRYFIVIDDIWEPQFWETIKLALVDDNCGCRVIITTRKLEVAKEGGEVYMLEPLSEDNSKKLFYTRLFCGEDKCPTNHVAELSGMILKKCGGVPLAIITMASLLLGKSRKEWIDVCNSPGLYQDKDDRHMENTMHILSLSYYDLPSHLKTCLLYLSTFPEDSLIDKDSLIWKWIAEGFVELKPGRGLFEVGEEYFHDLINRSVIQGVNSHVSGTKNSGVYGMMDGCRIHDMVLDLIVSISQQENFVSADGTLAKSHARRLAIKNITLDLTKDTTDVNLPQVRSFIVFRCDIVKWALHPRLKLIRVLELQNCTYTELALQHIGKLLHLRYLGIRDGWINKLPEGIGALKFLRTLDMERIGYPELPCNIGWLTQLVCLRGMGVSTPLGVIGKLTSLEELEIGGFRDKEESKRKFVNDLGNLCELRVLRLNHVWTMDESMQLDLMQSLGNLKKMQRLRVDHLAGIVNMNAWDALVPSRDLRCLFLPYVRFPMFPSWINATHLPSLSHLEIHVNHVDEQGFKALGGLPELCYLNLFSLGASNNEARGCFQKLRSWVLRSATVQFAASEDSSTSVTICHVFRGMAIGSRKKDDSRAVPAVVMPNLVELEFAVGVKELKKNNVVSCADLGLEYLPLLCIVKVKFQCYDAFEDDVEREKAALRHAIEVHPNRPTLQMECTGEMKRRSDDPVQPQTEEDEEEIG